MRAQFSLYRQSQKKFLFNFNAHVSVFHTSIPEILKSLNCVVVIWNRNIIISSKIDYVLIHRSILRSIQYFRKTAFDEKAYFRKNYRNEENDCWNYSSPSESISLILSNKITLIKYFWSKTDFYTELRLVS